MRLRHVLAATLLVGALPGLAQDLNIVTGVSLKDEGGTAVLSIVGSKAPNFTTFSMADPPRFVIDLSEARFQGVPEDMPINDGTILVVKNLSYGSDQTSIARIMVAFAVDVDPPDVQTQGSTLVVRVVKPGGAAAAVVAAPGGAEREAEAQAKAEAQKRADAEAQARAEAEAKAAAEAEGQLPAPPPPVAEPAGDAGKIAAAAAAVEQAAEAKAAADAEAKRQKDEALAAKKAELQRKREEAVAAKEEAKRQRLEAIAAARAAADEKKREEAERKAEARRQKQEALAAKQAEQQRKKEEAAAAKAEAKRAREESLAVTRPSHVRELGFKQLPGASRVFLRTSTPPRFTIQDVGENHIRVELENARAMRRNDLRFLDTSFFPGAVAMVTPSRHGSTFVLDIKLKQKVPYQQKVEGDMLAIDFERPAGAASAAPGPEAPAPADAASADAPDESGAAGTEPEATGAEPEAPVAQ